MVAGSSPAGRTITNHAMIDNKFMSPVIYAGVSPQVQKTIRNKNCFDTGELDIIARTVCTQFNIEGDEFRSRLRTSQLSDARKVFYYLCRIKLFTYTCRGLGEYMGGRDHSTVTVAVQRCEELIDIDPEFKELYKRCCEVSKQQLQLNGYSYKGAKQKLHGTTSYGDYHVSSFYNRERATKYASTVGELNC